MGNHSNIWEFLGSKKNGCNESEQILYKILGRFFEGIEMFSGLSYKNFDNIESMITVAKSKHDSYSYFWDWFEEIGISRLKVIASEKFDVSDETLDLLEYRLFILNEDIDSNILHNIIESLADTIGEIYKYALKTFPVKYEWSIEGLESRSKCDRENISKNLNDYWSIKTPLENTSGVSFLSYK